MTLIYVAISFAIIAFTLGVGFVLYNYMLTQANTKKPMQPKTAYPEVGICQCDDALCYHGVNGCSVPNCNCRAFVPSTMTNEEMQTITDVMVQRLTNRALEAPKTPPTDPPPVRRSSTQRTHDDWH